MSAFSLQYRDSLFNGSPEMFLDSKTAQNRSLGRRKYLHIQTWHHFCLYFFSCEG